MTLHELLALFTSKNIEYTTAHLDAVDQNAQLTDVASDSREVTPGSLFVCKGTHFSPAYLASAVAQRLFHPLIALGVHIVSNEVVMRFTANAFMILTIVPDRVVSTEVLEAGAVVGYSQEVSSSLLE